jgi:hypothetical protein
MDTESGDPRGPVPPAAGEKSKTYPFRQSWSDEERVTKKTRGGRPEKAFALRDRDETVVAQEAQIRGILSLVSSTSDS